MADAKVDGRILGNKRCSCENGCPQKHQAKTVTISFLMNPTQENSREYLQRTIDAAIKSLEESLRALKLRRNSLSLISSLPPEVFAAIFSILCLPGKPGYHLARIHISHVCHQWREIALNQPFLWSHDDYTTLCSAGAAERLMRAQSVPLYLEARVPAPTVSAVQFRTFSTELQARVPRIRHLSINAQAYHLYDTLEPLASPAPILEYLSLFNSAVSRNRGEEIFIPYTLFNGSTPRLSYLELRNCVISWKSPLLKGLKFLKIFTPPDLARPNLTVWLDSLNEMPQLKELTLHSAFPYPPPLPFDVERTVTLSSLTHLDFSACVGDCVVALAHLDLPALTCLCLTVIFDHIRANVSDIQRVLPYVVRHAHGPQDNQPLQSVLIHSNEDQLNILAWPVPDIDVEMHDLPALLGATLPTRVALSLKGKWWSNSCKGDIFGTLMEGLPLNGLVMLAAQDVDRQGAFSLGLSMKQFWLHHSPKWTLLRRVRLVSPVELGFIDMLLEDRGQERPLLPSLTELVLVSAPNHIQSTRFLCDALMKRVEQGVPLDMLDVRMYHSNPYNPAEVQLLSEIVVDVLGPEEAHDARETMRSKMLSLWDPLACGPFLK